MLPDRLAVNPGELGLEHRVEIALGVATDGRERGLQSDVDQVIQSREDAPGVDLRDAGEKSELDVRAALLRSGRRARGGSPG